MNKPYQDGWEDGLKKFRVVGKHEEPNNTYPVKSKDRQQFYLGFCAALENLAETIKDAKKGD